VSDRQGGHPAAHRRLRQRVAVLPIRQQRVDLGRRLGVWASFSPFAEVLPGRKLARFYQIENKIQAVLRYELAREIPVIEQ
jgi:hypothetical protein